MAFWMEIYVSQDEFGVFWAFFMEIFFLLIFIYGVIVMLLRTSSEIHAIFSLITMWGCSFVQICGIVLVILDIEGSFRTAVGSAGMDWFAISSWECSENIIILYPFKKLVLLQHGCKLLFCLIIIENIKIIIFFSSSSHHFFKYHQEI